MVRLLQDKECYEFFELYKEFLGSLGLNVTRFEASFRALNEINKEGSFILGSFKDGVLTGFITGYPVSEEEFYFANIYCTEAKQVLPLLRTAEKEVIRRGYRRWKAEAITQQGKRVLEMMGGKNG